MDALTMPSRYRHALSDALWARLSPMLPRRSGAGRLPTDHRLVMDGIIWILRTGAPWRDLPERFGPWKTVYERFRLWSRSGFWQTLRAKLVAADHAAGHLDWSLFLIDATNVRAHKASAGARKKSRLSRNRRITRLA